MRVLHRMFGPIEPPRTAMEFGALMAWAPCLMARHSADGHPVLVVPGLSGGPVWTLTLRTVLRGIGHSVYGPRTGTMKRTHRNVVAALSDRVDDLADLTGRTVSLVGWSVGGCYARQVAARSSDSVRQVVTLGAPLDGAWYAKGSAAPDRLSVPSTAVYTRTDWIFDYHRCLQPAGRRSENVPIPSSHLGMANNPFAVEVIADRLGQPEGVWKPYAAA